MDGRLHWLRWLDRIDTNGEIGSARITAYLVALPEGTDRQNLPALSTVAGSKASASPYPVIAGSLPALRLGMVFHNGVPAGDLPMEREVRRSFGSSETVALVRCDEEVPKPEWARAKWTVIPATKYSLGTAVDSFCLCLRGDGFECLVPASEVFRVFCAPETLLANVLLSGDWKIDRGKVLNEAHCERHPGEWRVGLRTGLNAISALPIAAYHWTEAGQATRNLLRAHFHKGDFRLRATIPYAFDSIALAGEGLWLNPIDGVRRFLMLRVTSASFPSGIRELPALVAYRLDNNNVQRSPGMAGDNQPAFGQAVPTMSSDTTPGAQTLSVTTPPSSVAPLAPSPYEAATMAGLPTVAQLPLDPPRPSDTQRRRLAIAQPTNVGSTAMRQRGHRDVAAVEHLSEARPSSGFGSVATVLDGFLHTGLIASWMPTVPENSPWRVVAGIESWEMPAEVDSKRAPFSFLRDGRRRTCLVAEIEINRRKVYWLELERRQSVGVCAKGFRYLLMKTDEGSFEDVVASLLRSAAREKGIWTRIPKPDPPSTHKAVRHAYVPEDPGSLCPVSALREIIDMARRTV